MAERAAMVALSVEYEKPGNRRTAVPFIRRHAAYAARAIALVGGGSAWMFAPTRSLPGRRTSTSRVCPGRPAADEATGLRKRSIEFVDGIGVRNVRERLVRLFPGRRIRPASKGYALPVSAPAFGLSTLLARSIPAPRGTPLDG
jgi:hypothetical protein